MLVQRSRAHLALPVLPVAVAAVATGIVALIVESLVDSETAAAAFAIVAGAPEQREDVALSLAVAAPPRRL